MNENIFLVIPKISSQILTFHPRNCCANEKLNPSTIFIVTLIIIIIAFHLRERKKKTKKTTKSFEITST